MNNHICKLLLLPALFFIAFTATAQQTAQKLIKETNYLLYLPEGYANDTTVNWPLMLFLHGAGETGADIEKVKVHGPPKLIAQGKKYPFIVVSPQASTYGWRAEDLVDLLREVMNQYRVDKDRLYLTGLSMGGFGTWDIAIKYPNMFAAIVPICGGGDTSKIWRLRNMPVWCFHGGKDNVVNISQSEKMVNALKKYNPNVKFTIYPEADHDSWSMTYSNDSVYEWMLAHKRFVYKQVPVSEKILKTYTGSYLFGNDTVKFTLEENKLMCSWSGRPTFQIKAANDKLFFMDENAQECIVFESGQAGKVSGFTAFIWNDKVFFRKLSK